MRPRLAVAVRAVRIEKIISLIHFGFLGLVGIILDYDRSVVRFTGLCFPILTQFTDDRNL